VGENQFPIWKKYRNDKTIMAMNSNQNKPKIAFITTGYPSNSRPHECIFVHRSIKVLCDLIQPEVIHFRALLPGRPVVEERVWDGINVQSVSCPQLPFGSYSHLNTRLIEFFGDLFIRKVIRSSDLIHGVEAYPSGFLSGMWASKYKKPFTFNVIGSDLNIFLKRNYTKLDNDWLTNLKGVVCNSNALQNGLHQLMGEFPNVRTIYRGVDTVVFAPNGVKAGPQALLPPVCFLYLGGFHTLDPGDATYNLKGEHTLLDAWRLVENQLPAASIAIGGPGEYQELIHSWQAKLTNPQRAFCLKSIDPSDIASYIRSSDVVIIPSISEGLPNLAKEALACGRPVLATNVGGIPEVVENGKTGLIISPGDPKALADGIRWFCENQDQIMTMGKTGRKRMIECFSWDQYKRNMIEFFQSGY
jgi:glycosyltransferase involved in cell wall biosynthesis